MLKIDVDVRGLEALQKKLGPQLYEDALTEYLTEATDLGQKVAREGIKDDTNALARSVLTEVRPLSARIYSTLPYAVPVDQGRRAGAKMPPPNALRGWMQRHGMGNVPPFVLARAIARRGIRGRFFLRAAKERIERETPNMLRRAARTIEQKWGRR